MNNNRPYSFRNKEGRSNESIIGPWIVEGPNIEPLTFMERETAAVVTRALNLAYIAGKAAQVEEVKQFLSR